MNDTIDLNTRTIDDYQLPHPLDRTDQLSTIQRILASNAQYIIVQAPTGSGKTAWAAYASQYLRTMAVVETKSLQAQYQEQYSFMPSYGRNNYLCADTGENAENCPNTSCHLSCEYAIARRNTIQSPRVIINYAKYALDQRLTDQHNTDILFLDEAHRLDDIVKDKSAIEIKWDHKFIRLPPMSFPEGNHEISIKRGNEALAKIAWAIKENEVVDSVGQPKSNTRIQWERLSRKVKTIRQFIALDANIAPNSWFYSSKDGKLTIKPLTAKHNFKKIFNTAPKIVLMSATIGNNPKPLADALGIDDYEYIEIMGEFGPDMRPVYDLGAPSISYKSKPGDYDEQARLIVNAINNLPKHWTGLLGVKSKSQARELSNRLNARSESAWFVTIPQSVTGTEHQLAWWEANRQPGTYLIHWAFWEGVDLGKDNVVGICKVPFGYAGDTYGKAAMDFNRSMYQQKPAWDCEQIAGRVRRGHDSHYGANAKKFVFIADGAYRRIRSRFSNAFAASIKPYIDFTSSNDIGNMAREPFYDDTDDLANEIPF